MDWNDADGYIVVEPWDLTFHEPNLDSLPDSLPER